MHPELPDSAPPHHPVAANLPIRQEPDTEGEEGDEKEDDDDDEND
jgi:hypothetical protein